MRTEIDNQRRDVVSVVGAYAYGSPRVFIVRQTNDIEAEPFSLCFSVPAAYFVKDPI